jgi:hypothetical protein
MLIQRTLHFNQLLRNPIELLADRVAASGCAATITTHLLVLPGPRSSHSIWALMSDLTELWSLYMLH